MTAELLLAITMFCKSQNETHKCIREGNRVCLESRIDRSEIRFCEEKLIKCVKEKGSKGSLSNCLEVYFNY